MNPRSNFMFATVLLVFAACTAFQWQAASSSTPAAAATNTGPLVPQAAADPVLYFSDITSGPRTGNSDTSGGRSGQDGAIVTLWGRNLGGSQGSSQVYANGAAGASTYFWGNATAPADLFSYHQMQMISFQVSHLAQDGAGQIYVVVNGRQSNALPFNVRPGNIYFAAVTGHDDSGDGSWDNPWRTIPAAAGSLAAGDIAYIGNGVDQTSETDVGAAVNLGSDGLPGSPKALIVYPGAVSKVGNASLGRAFHVWNSDTAGYSTHWVIAKFQLTTAEVGVTAQAGFRVIGNHVTAPNGDGMDGAIGARNGDQIYILGNELENIGAAPCSKLYHAIYITGARQDSPPRAPTESDHEVAWNYLHDNRSNRAINAYSEQAYSAFIQHIRIHDNVIINQRGDGILLGYYVTGENWVYNNLVVQAGLGPEWSDDPSSHSGLRLDTGHEEVSQTTVHVYNNTLYGSGWSGAAWAQSGSVLIQPEALARSTTVLFSNNILYSTGEPYMAGESTALPAGDYRNCWYGAGAAPAWDTTSIQQDPMFISPGTFNFQLQNGSPCIKSGKNLSAVVARDLLGVPRPPPGGPAFDLGAYEHVAQTVTVWIKMYLPLLTR